VPNRAVICEKTYILGVVPTNNLKIYFVVVSCDAVNNLLICLLVLVLMNSDHVIEQYVGGLPVKDIFRERSEAGFRELEVCRRTCWKILCIYACIVQIRGSIRTF
jgi:hypothetical protein